jgi:hypothetical protein
MFRAIISRITKLLKYWIKNPLPIEYGMAKNYLFQVIIAKQVVWAELGVTLPPNK